MLGVDSDLHRRASALRDCIVLVGERLAHARDASTGLAVTRKADSSLVSTADLEAEQTFREMIHRRFPGDRVVGEEGGVDGAVSSAYTWVIDPLDGTTNYLAGAAEYAIAGAVIDAYGRHAVAISQPAIRAYAEHVAGGPTNLTGFTAPSADDTGRIVLGVGFAGDAVLRSQQFDAIRGWLTLPTELREIGSASVSLSRLAAGQFDGYCELNLPIWDVLPGVLLARAAGCHVFAPLDISRLVKENGRSHVVVASSRAASLVRTWYATVEDRLAKWQM